MMCLNCWNCLIKIFECWNIKLIVYREWIIRGSFKKYSFRSQSVRISLRSFKIMILWENQLSWRKWRWELAKNCHHPSQNLYFICYDKHNLCFPFIFIQSFPISTLNRIWPKRIWRLLCSFNRKIITNNNCDCFIGRLNSFGKRNFNDWWLGWWVW